MTFLPSNDQRDASSNIRVSHTSPVPSSIRFSSSPGSFHLVSPAGPGGHLHVCSGSLSPYTVEDIMEEVAFEQGLERGIQL